MGHQVDGHNRKAEVKSEEAINLKKNRKSPTSATEARSVGVCILIHSSCDECIKLYLELFIEMHTKKLLSSLAKGTLCCAIGDTFTFHLQNLGFPRSSVS